MEYNDVVRNIFACVRIMHIKIKTSFVRSRNK